jgi:gliding motility-associated-like protein
MHITSEVDQIQRFGDTLQIPVEKPIEIYSPGGYSEYIWFAIDDLGFELTEVLTQNTTLTAYENSILSIQATTSDGCIESDTLFIAILRPIDEIATVFTPNGDGVNDFWEIANTIGKPDLEVLIFNRWGQQIFYSKSYGTDETNTWDGKSQKSGKDLPVVTYYYIIKPNDGEQEPITGTVTIVR